MGFHPFHMVDLSPWPLLASLAVSGFMISFFSYMKGSMIYYPMFGVIPLILVVFQWWRDVVRESTYQGNHSIHVMKGLYLGVGMFILSEIFFFFSFFFGYFFLALSPEVSLGSWPPVGIQPMDYLGVPVVNTILLLSSGVSVTWAHHSLVEKNLSSSGIGLFFTILLGLVFLGLQGLEYVECPFTMADSVYGSLFFITTGFHGIHVLVGMIFIIVGLSRVMMGHFSKSHHLGLEASIWYWHFVDVVWLFLFLSIYWWGN